MLYKTAQARSVENLSCLYFIEGAQVALSHITENRNVWTRESLIFPRTVFGFGLEKAILRQSQTKSNAQLRPKLSRPLSLAP